MLIGVSPGNSYFSSERITGLAQWATTRFAQVDFVYADLHVDRMFAAFGYTPEHAEKRATKEIKAVRRRILKGVEESGPPQADIRVRALSEFQSNPVYQLLHRRVLHFLETDDEFRKGCEKMALHFVGSKLPEGESITDEQLQVCFDYMAAELPFFVDTPSILDVPSSVAAYHVKMPLTDVLFARGGDCARPATRRTPSYGPRPPRPRLRTAPRTTHRPKGSSMSVEQLEGRETGSSRSSTSRSRGAVTCSRRSAPGCARRLRSPGSAP
ncbi:tRNA-dependent cyclodipeptide synthase [Streptomyces sp. MS1.HAVA.3]|uniref:Cyclodipeptide synthase n=1 Tax=Streptomyces caledonius TaxID=3134107 RepID=A0ABU8U3D3_9ACTN